MPERVADAIEEIARPNRGDQQENPRSRRKTSFGSAVFKCLRASFDSPAEWKNVEFDWDNPPGGSQPAVPRCITPRPWPPYLVARVRNGSPPQTKTRTTISTAEAAWQHWSR